MKRSVARWGPGAWIVLALSLVVVSSSMLAAGERVVAAESASLEMALRHGNLTAEAVTAPLHEVMAEIGKLTGAAVHWLNQPGTERVSVTIVDVPLPEALARLLGRNFTLAYAASGQVTDIWIVSRHSPEHGPRRPAPAGRVSVLDDGRAKPPTGRNQSRVEGDPDAGISDARVGSREGIDIAAQPPRVRMEAVELLAMRADQDEAAREILSHVASMDADPQVRHLAAMALVGLR